MNDWNDFDRTAGRGFTAMIVLMALCLAFLAAAISAVIFAAGRILGAW